MYQTIVGSNDGVGQIALGLLQLQYFFLDCVASDEPVGKHLPRLADAMGPVDRLRFNRRVPPGVEKINVFGRVQVESQPAGFQADEKQLHVGIVLKLLNPRLPVARLAVKVHIGDLRAVEPAAHDSEQTRELGKDQSLMSFFEHLIELREQGIHFSARLRRLLFIDQTRMTGGLAQAQQRFEHLELHLSQAITLSIFQ